jgi:hypothetical protein
LTEPNNNLIGDTTWIHYPSPRRQKARHHGLLSHGQVLSLNQTTGMVGNKSRAIERRVHY